MGGGVMADADSAARPDALRPVRSALFVPANREPWIEKSPAYGADVVVLDLEDATPPTEKQAAQEILQRAIPVLRGRGQGVWVRINEIDGPFVADDLEAIVWPGLEAVCLPKVTGPEAVRELDSMLTAVEGRHGLASGAIRIVPLLETAPAILGAADVFRSSSRVAYGGGIVAPSGDVALAIGFRWSDTFEETLVLRSQVLIAARASGIDNPITGLVTSVDPEPVRRFAEQSRSLGYAGMFVIHPSHVAIANEAFRPSAEELAWCTEILAAAETAGREGRGTFVDSQGRMIDVAMLRVARGLLERDRAFRSREPKPR
jgi:citrate lyase subunit beta/citryl-CoA lyase